MKHFNFTDLSAALMLVIICLLLTNSIIVFTRPEIPIIVQAKEVIWLQAQIDRINQLNMAGIIAEADLKELLYFPYQEALVISRQNEVDILRNELTDITRYRLFAMDIYNIRARLIPIVVLQEYNLPHTVLPAGGWAETYQYHPSIRE